MIKDGIININKSAGMTSHDCVQVLRRLTGIKRIGHTGTLDPMATGVLPLCIGNATRIMEYLNLDLKVYRCTMTLGIETDTQDIWGTALLDRREELRQIQKNGQGFTHQDIEKVFSRFNGLIDQVPPKYSALKVAGRKLYEYARAGETVEIKNRKIWIESLIIRDIDLNQMMVSFDVTCSKGTYIRTICADVGESLGCGGAMSYLCRLGSGIFSIKDAVSQEELLTMDESQLSQLVLEPDYPLIHFGKVLLERQKADRFCNGGHIPMGAASIEALPEFETKSPPFPIRADYKRAYNIYERDGNYNHFLGVAIYHPQEDTLVADKVFARRQGG